MFLCGSIQIFYPSLFVTSLFISLFHVFFLLLGYLNFLVFLINLYVGFQAIFVCANFQWLLQGLEYPHLKFHICLGLVLYYIIINYRNLAIVYVLLYLPTGLHVTDVLCITSIQMEHLKRQCYNFCFSSKYLKECKKKTVF